MNLRAERGRRTKPCTGVGRRRDTGRDAGRCAGLCAGLCADRWRAAKGSWGTCRCGGAPSCGTSRPGRYVHPLPRTRSSCSGAAVTGPKPVIIGPGEGIGGGRGKGAVGSCGPSGRNTAPAEPPDGKSDTRKDEHHHRYQRAHVFSNPPVKECSLVHILGVAGVLTGHRRALWTTPSGDSPCGGSSGTAGKAIPRGSGR